MFGFPPSATEQRYTCMKDLLLCTHTLTLTMSSLLGSLEECFFFTFFTLAHDIVHVRMSLFASGVFFLSVLTMFGSPPSATEQRYMCMKDLPLCAQ